MTELKICVPRKVILATEQEQARCKTGEQILYKSLEPTNLDGVHFHWRIGIFLIISPLHKRNVHSLMLARGEIRQDIGSGGLAVGLK